MILSYMFYLKKATTWKLSKPFTSFLIHATIKVMTTLNAEEQVIWDNIENYDKNLNEHDAMAYYASVPAIKALGIDMPLKYLMLCPPVPRILLEQEDDALNVYYEDGTVHSKEEVFTEETAKGVLEKLTQEFPNHEFDNVNSLSGSTSLFDSRFPSHHYRMDLYDKKNRVSTYLFYKKGEFLNDNEKNYSAFRLVSRFFECLHEHQKRSRRNRKTKEIIELKNPEISYSYSTMDITSGYDKTDRAFVDVRVRDNPLPIVGRDYGS